MISLSSAKKTPRAYINAMKKIAESRGGRIVSSKWKGSSESYEFVDATNHTFVSDYNSVMRGRWSPHEGKISEPLCRQVMEHLFKDDFPSTRAVLLPQINGSEFAWELDGYCEEKKLPSNTKAIHATGIQKIRIMKKPPNVMLKKSICATN